MTAARSAFASENPLDVGRGLAIVAVIYGHALAPWIIAAGGHFSQDAFLQWKFGASFMMTFFFFLSGVGWRAERSIVSALRQGLTLLVLAWFVAVAFDFFCMVLNQVSVAAAVGAPQTTPLGFVRGALRLALLADKYPVGAMWFLATLGIVRVLATIVVRAGALATGLLAATLLLLTFVSIDFDWRNVAQIHLLGVAFTAFIAGYWARNVWKRAEAAPLWCVGAAIAGLAAAVFTFALNQGCRWNPLHSCGVDWLQGEFGVSMVMGQFGNLALFTFTAVAGAVFAGAVSLLIARRSGGALVAGWGRRSMDLLIVNAAFVALINPLVAAFIAPHVAAEGLPFFAALFFAVLIVNLGARALFARPLWRLRAFARRLAGRIVEAGVAIWEQAVVVLRVYRVSREHD